MIAFELFEYSVSLLNYLNRKLKLCLLGAEMSERVLKALAIVMLVATALALRVSVAPYSSGSDIPQFAGFADTFLKHKSCFYSFAGGSNAVAEGWPYNWPYVYGPIWIYALGILRLIAPQPVKHFYIHSHYYVFAPITWIVAVKSILIVTDLVVGLLILYVIYRWRGFRAGFLASAAYLLNPVTIYVSSIYGMFDSLVALFLVSSLVLYELRDSVSGILSSLAILTKQVATPATLPLIIDSVLNLKKKWRYLIYGIVTSILIYLPLVGLCPQSLHDALRALLGINLKITYTVPISYSFNGFSSLATYLHYHLGSNYLWVLKSWFIPYIILQAMTIIYYLRSKNVLVSSYLSYVSFIATYWRVNYQYLVTLVALSLISLPKLRKLSTKIVSVTSSVIFPAIWPIAFPTSWWFHVHIENPNQYLISLVNSLTLMIFNDRFYVVYSLVLTSLLYATVAIVLGTLFRGKDRKQNMLNH